MLDRYDLGATTFYACQYDQRFSYCLYVPHSADDQQPMELLVLVHGSRRTPETYRDNLAAFAERNQVVVLCPLFPVGIPEPNETGGYKFVEMAGIRYDLVVLAMIDEVSTRIPVKTDNLMMHGFSGGGQFTHRFLYLHAERLKAVSVGAPGLITLLDQSQGWWLGIADMEEKFGIKPNFDTIRSVPIQLLVGAQDLETAEINLTPASKYWIPDCNKAGTTRVERCYSLQHNWLQQGLQVELEVVAGIGHNGYELLPQVEQFFEGLMSKG